MDVEQAAAARAAAEEQDKNKDTPSVSENRSVHVGDSDLLGGEKLDAVLTAKMALVNDVRDKRRD
jgi:hypothetical protein